MRSSTEEVKVTQELYFHFHRTEFPTNIATHSTASLSQGFTTSIPRCFAVSRLHYYASRPLPVTDPPAPTTPPSDCHFTTSASSTAVSDSYITLYHNEP
ncbi:hypothetical protein E2C01_071164 [Portunus trituberculatus]|uniref:Uncharacterized protein n=1 Tax=Portunus trituberculatus TaxID=210409 RepID=A0A5B7I437_PORTR|nr:hypothetical protein [Portunus trituberculatus]